MSIDRPNLAASFTAAATHPAAASRAQGLAGILPPKPRTPPAEPNMSEGTPEQAAPASSARPKKVTRIAPEPAGTSNVAIYVEPDLYERVREARRTRNCTYDQLVVDAFAAISTDTLKQHFPLHPTQIPAGGMPARQRRSRGTSGLQLQLRLDGAQREWLRDKGDEVGAPSRSALVSTALRLYLDGESQLA